MLKKRYLVVVLLCAAVFSMVAYNSWQESSLANAGLQEVANGDAQFWLMQGEPNNRYIPCTVYYSFDAPLDTTQVLKRLKDLADSYTMFQRNIVEIDGLPYWQNIQIDWNKNFRVLDADEDIEAVREQADVDVSQPSMLGEGLPLFRAYLSADRRQLIFVWHHVISDLEGMFNKHAKHLFAEEGERTKFGYQIQGPDHTENKAKQASTSSIGKVLALAKNADRPLGFTATNNDVAKIILPIKDKDLYALGKKKSLPMSDIFSFITLRAVTYYEQTYTKGSPDKILENIRPLISPISLRKNSLATDEGNNRALREFPFIMPLESVSDMHHRIVSLPPTSSSYETAGLVMKLARRFPTLASGIGRTAMPDYISNYFPLADIPLAIGEANLVSHHLRVPMVPYERSKFAWSNYNGEVQLFLHTDPVLIDEGHMIDSFNQASAEVLQFLKNG